MHAVVRSLAAVYDHLAAEHDTDVSGPVDRLARDQHPAQVWLGEQHVNVSDGPARPAVERLPSVHHDEARARHGDVLLPGRREARPRLTGLGEPLQGSQRVGDFDDDALVDAVHVDQFVFASAQHHDGTADPVCRVTRPGVDRHPEGDVAEEAALHVGVQHVRRAHVRAEPQRALAAHHQDLAVRQQRGGVRRQPAVVGEAARAAGTPAVQLRVVDVREAGAALAGPAADQHHVAVVHRDGGVVAQRRRAGRADLAPDARVTVQHEERVARLARALLRQAAVYVERAADHDADVVDARRPARRHQLPAHLARVGIGHRRHFLRNSSVSGSTGCTSRPRVLL